MRALEVIRLLTADGWVEFPSKGSHRQFKHPTKPGKTTVPFHRGDLTVVILGSIERQSGVTLRQRR